MKPETLANAIVGLLRELEKYDLSQKITIISGIRREMAKHVDGTPWSGAYDDVYNDEETE